MKRKIIQNTLYIFVFLTMVIMVSCVSTNNKAPCEVKKWKLENGLYCHKDSKWNIFRKVIFINVNADTIKLEYFLNVKGSTIFIINDTLKLHVNIDGSNEYVGQYLIIKCENSGIILKQNYSPIIILNFAKDGISMLDYQPFLFVLSPGKMEALHGCKNEALYFDDFYRASEFYNICLIFGRYNEMFLDNTYRRKRAENALYFYLISNLLPHEEFVKEFQKIRLSTMMEIDKAEKVQKSK